MQAVPESVSFPDRELQTLQYWEEIDAFAESNRRAAERPLYSFYDGPPFATGLPHYGHLLAGTIKDTVTRFAYQSGHSVPRRFGWDCHGLPVEFEIEQKLGITSRDDVLALGIDKYNEECRSIVMRYSREWEQTVKRMGRWIDFENDYKTMDASFMESVWWVFRRLHELGLVYKGFRVMPYSTACTTPLSNFEANLNYKDVQDPAITVSFPVVATARGETTEEEEVDCAELLTWTTTPWTLPSNMALCVNANFVYVRVRDNTRDKRVFIVAETRLGELFKDPAKARQRGDFEELSRCTGAELVGTRYKPMFDYFARPQQPQQLLGDPFRVLADDYVTSDSGTGIVHQAPAFGEDDYRVCLEAGVILRDGMLPCPVDESGRFTEPVSDLAGVPVKQADKQLIKKMKAAGRMIKHETYQHSYPFCWRSDTPLIYRAVPSWFIAVERIKARLIAANEQTYWVPASIRENRFGNWLANARDWNVSRNRYWGTPLPIWQSEDGEEIMVIGSVAELEQRSGRKPGSITDLHRHFIDDIEIVSPSTGATLRRVEEVFDCWFESGSMPYAQQHYPFADNAESFLTDGSFPAKFIAEGVDQTRGWFYTLTVLGAALFDKPPFENVVVNGLVLAEDGKKMSKRLKNYPDPSDVIRRHGADALRLYLIDSPVVRAESLRFREAGVRDIVREVLLPWYNAYRFFVQNALAVGGVDAAEARVAGAEAVAASAANGGEQGVMHHGRNAMDAWISSLLGSLIAFVRREMAAYRLYTVVPRLLSFIEALTNWYVRLNRPRLKGAGRVTAAEQRRALAELGDVLLTLSQLMAPFAPFMSEWTYQNLKRLAPPAQRCDSVHYLLVPEERSADVDTGFEQAVARMQQAVLLGRAIRERRTVPVKQPLRRALIIHRDAAVLDDIRELEAYVRTELNVRSVEYSTDEDRYVRRSAVPDGRLLGRRLGKTFQSVLAEVRAMSAEQVAEFESAGSMRVCDGQVTLTAEEVFVSRDVNRDAVTAEQELDSDPQSGVVVMLDLSMDEELVLDGWAREAVNRVQRLRKKAGLVPTDQMEVFLCGGGGETVRRVLAERAAQVGDMLGAGSVGALHDERALHALQSLDHVRVPVVAEADAEPIHGEPVRVVLVRRTLWPLLPTATRGDGAVDARAVAATCAYVQCRDKSALFGGKGGGDAAPSCIVSVDIGGDAARVDVRLTLGENVFDTVSAFLAAWRKHGCAASTA